MNVLPPICTAKIGILFLSKFKVGIPQLPEERLHNIFRVLDVPQPPQDVRVTMASSRHVQLEWSPPTSDGGNPIQEFIIFYKSNGKTEIV